MYCVDSLASCFFTFEKIYEYDKTGINIGNQDYYSLYFWGTILTYVIVIFYLKYLSPKECVTEMKKNQQEKINLLGGCFICICLYYVFGGCAEFLYPVVALLLMETIIDAKYRPYYLAALCILFVLFKNIFLVRFRFIQIVFPVAIMCVCLGQKRVEKKNMYKVYILMIVLLLFGLSYGVVSEVYKLNHQYGMDISFDVVIKSKDLIWKYCMSQMYRILVVWIKMGGYVIYEVQRNGYYYGLTYVKALSGILGIDYISIPEIAARYNGSTYCQTGLLAEGYANFGILGIVINLSIVFFVMEYFRYKYIKNSNMINLCYMTVPFTKIILDGGSLNSAVALLFACFVMNSVNNLTYLKRNNMKIYIRRL